MRNWAQGIDLKAHPPDIQFLHPLYSATPGDKCVNLRLGNSFYINCSTGQGATRVVMQLLDRIEAGSDHTSGSLQGTGPVNTLILVF